MPVDAATLLIAGTIVQYTGAMLFLLVWKLYRQQNLTNTSCLFVWSAALALIGSGSLLVGLRGTLSDLFSIVAANAILLFGVGLFRTAVADLLGQKRHLPMALLPGLIWLCLCAYPPFISNLLPRLFVVQAGIFVTLVWTSYICLRHNQANLITSRLMGITVAGQALSHLFLLINAYSTEFATFLVMWQADYLKIYLLSGLLFTCGTIILSFAMFVEKHQLYFQWQAGRDPLTLLPNSRGFGQQITEWQDGNTLAQAPFSVAKIDIDHLKKINEDYVPALGDAVLQLLARICRDMAGENAIIGRGGGEDITILFPGLPVGKAALQMEQIRRAFTASTARAGRKTFKATASIGVSGGSPSNTDFEGAASAATEALMKAKKLGRNRLCMAAAPIAEDPETDHDAAHSADPEAQDRHDNAA